MNKNENEKILIEGKFSYDRMGLCVGLAIAFILLAIIQLIIIIPTKMWIGLTWTFIFLFGGLMLPFFAISIRNQVYSRSLKIYANRIEYRSGGSKGSFIIKTADLQSSTLKKAEITINGDRNKMITFLVNAPQVDDVLQSLIKGENLTPKKAEQQAVISNNLSNADEIRKYKQLFDDGIITREEFENKKKELLKS